VSAYNKLKSIDEVDKKKKTKVKTEFDELQEMAFNTAYGIYNMGWKKGGYWFATPEGDNESLMNMMRK
jgi:hypothetical protein